MSGVVPHPGARTMAISPTHPSLAWALPHDGEEWGAQEGLPQQVSEQVGVKKG